MYMCIIKYKQIRPHYLMSAPAIQHPGFPDIRTALVTSGWCVTSSNTFRGQNYFVTNYCNGNYANIKGNLCMHRPIARIFHEGGGGGGVVHTSRTRTKELILE